MPHAVPARPRARRAFDALCVLLRRNGWRPDLGHVGIACRDLGGRRTRLVIIPTPRGVVLVASRPGPVLVRPLDVGRLRGALKVSVLVGASGKPAPSAAVDAGLWQAAA